MPLVFSVQDRNIAFHFAVLCYANPSRNSFSYRLKNRQKDWIDLGHKGSVSFNSMKPGNYILNIKGANHDGIWNAKGLSVRFKVNRSFWNLAFYLVLVGFAAAALVLLWLYSQKKNDLIPEKDEAFLDSIRKEYELSQREKEIIELLLLGKKNEEIGDQLFISPNTVKNHVHNIYRKLNIKNRLQLLNFLQKHKP